MQKKLRVLYYNTFLPMNMGEGMVSRCFLTAASQLDGWELVTVPSAAPEKSSTPKTGFPAKTRRLAPATARKSIRSLLSPTSPYPPGPYLYKRGMRAHLNKTLAKHGDFDVMLLHPSQGDLGTLAELGRYSRVPIVLRAPGPFAYQADQVFRRYMSGQDRQHERFLYDRAEAICVISEHMKQLMVQATGVSTGKLFAVPNGINFASFDPEKTDRQRMRQQLGLNGRLVAGYIGGFWPGNDLTTLLHAWRLVENVEPEATLLLVGRGPTLEQSQALSRSLNLQNCLWVDRIPHTDVPHYIAAMDVGIGPYVAAALEFVSPLKVMEYMTMAVPTVATDGGQISELVTPGVTGYLYQAGKAEQLQSHLLTLLRAPETAVTMGSRARQHILNWYSWEDIARKMLSICQQVAN